MSFGSFSFGSATYGGSPATAGTTYGVDLSIVLGGTDYTDNLLLDTLRITDNLGARNSCEFTLKDDTKGFHLQPGTVVRVSHDGALKFAGTVEEVREYTAGDFSDVNMLEVSCVDWNQLADRHVVTGKFASRLTLRDIVVSIVNTISGDIGERLSNEGVTYAGVQTGPRLGVVAFNYQSAADCFDDLAELTGYAWYIDYNKDLRFFDRSTYLAPYELDDSRWQSYRRLQVTRSRDQYRNVQWLRAGVATTGTRVEKFKGDGETKTFTLAMPVAEEPTLMVDTTPVSAADVDVRKDDADQATIEWFYKVGDKQITQNSDDTYTALTSSEKLTVSYNGQYPIVQQARDELEIDDRQAIEKDGAYGTGVYVEVEEDEKIDDLEMAIERCRGILRRYGKITTTVSFETDVGGFLSGQILTVNQPDLGLSGEYLVASVETSLVADNFFRASVTAVSGDGLESLTDFFKRLAKKGRPMTIRDNEQINYLSDRKETLVVGDAVSLTESLQAWTVDTRTRLVIGDSRLGGRRSSTSESNDGTGVVYGPMIGWPYVY